MTTSRKSQQTRQEERFQSVKHDHRVIRLGLYSPHYLFGDSIYLAGSNTGQVSNLSTSWRIDAVHVLRDNRYTGFICYPEALEGVPMSNEGLSYWQDQELGRATRVVLWFDTNNQCIDNETHFLIGRLFEQYRHDTEQGFELYVGWEGIRPDLVFVSRWLSSHRLRQFESLKKLCEYAAVGAWE